MDPYIGITDFTDISPVQRMSEIFAKNAKHGSKRKLHAGVMMSYKTLNSIPSKWQNVFPPKEKIAEIFACPEVYNCLHYADYDNNPEFVASLVQAIYFGGGNLSAVQLDMTWPDPAAIADALILSVKKPEIILQLGKNALEQVGNDPTALITKLRSYRGIISRVLLDRSMGRGLGIDAKGLIPFAEAIKVHFPEIGLGAAGGLGPETIYLVEPLAKAFPDLSIDAQARLRPSGSALDLIDWDIAGDYLIKAIKLFS